MKADLSSSPRAASRRARSAGAHRIGTITVFSPVPPSGFRPMAGGVAEKLSWVNSYIPSCIVPYIRYQIAYRRYGGKPIMFDATELEVARREAAYEMGAPGELDRSWSRFFDAAEKAVIAHGWDGKFTNGKSRGLDGNEYTGEGEPSDGYSIDSAYDAWEVGKSVDAYIAECAKRRSELGL